MGKSHSQIIKAFFNGKNYTGHNVFARHYENGNDVLYSYGTHFPLAIKRDGGKWYLLNGDKYSNSTSHHQSMTYKAQYPRVSFTALHAAGLCEDTVELIDYEGDQSDYAWPGEEKFTNFQVPIGAEYHERKDRDGNVTWKSWHRIGGVVLKNHTELRDTPDGTFIGSQDNYYLCAMDEGSYFISLLPGTVSTVAEAFESLKPVPVIQALRNNQDVKRQGEWFFVPVDYGPCKEKDYEKAGTLLVANDSSNPHVVTRLYKAADGALFVKGIVRHKGRWGGKGDHRPVKLGDTVHIALLNTAKGNWSAGGKVD